jgi:enoyl-CoA hydratase/carnithine racemase
MSVEKNGRATGYTTGKISDVSANLMVQFEDRMLQFEDQLLVTGDGAGFSAGGDSGALVVDIESGRAAGLVIGGGPNVTIANHIGDVLAALDVLLVR